MTWAPLSSLLLRLNLSNPLFLKPFLLDKSRVVMELNLQRRRCMGPKCPREDMRKVWRTTIKKGWSRVDWRRCSRRWKSITTTAKKVIARVMKEMSSKRQARHKNLSFLGLGFSSEVCEWITGSPVVNDHVVKSGIKEILSLWPPTKQEDTQSLVLCLGR